MCFVEYAFVVGEARVKRRVAELEKRGNKPKTMSERACADEGERREKERRKRAESKKKWQRKKKRKEIKLRRKGSARYGEDGQNGADKNLAHMEWCVCVWKQVD
ncbi:uncharacterized protein SPSK_03735 [Sporothrix schenckii 1099-18]|uniref:Uncharacterized protein n=1 Tax=Sporothrix schenckii 1099-18 TaxID=1397361 RepID=A0A0F2LYT5_SPOSC|nr:uncharacterized protein SPSK_03735 [Sporothrix schenckii 1099-18]KJR82632.1 hypothetical protein SPSK_03735 [Sporothrix schenckii 1099-18]